MLHHSMDWLLQAKTPFMADVSFEKFAKIIKGTVFCVNETTDVELAKEVRGHAFTTV